MAYVLPLRPPRFTYPYRSSPHLSTPDLQQFNRRRFLFRRLLLSLLYQVLCLFMDPTCVFRDVGMGMDVVAGRIWGEGYWERGQR
jgi:hypothetical protein